VEMLVPILAALCAAATPILYATLGEILTRDRAFSTWTRGLMLVRGLYGFSVASGTGNAWLGIAAAFLAGCLLALVHAFLCITGVRNQVVSGLALTSSARGFPRCSARFHRRNHSRHRWHDDSSPLEISSKIPVLGPTFFRPGSAGLSFLRLAVFLTCFSGPHGGATRRSGPLETRPGGGSHGSFPTRLRYLYTVIVEVSLPWAERICPWSTQNVVRPHDGGTRMDRRVALVSSPSLASTPGCGRRVPLRWSGALQLRIQLPGRVIPRLSCSCSPYVFTIFVLSSFP
jgi:simple sugar transport system permease protein